MAGYAAEATWGIPGPTFLIIYLGAAVAVAVLATVHRRALFAGTGGPAPTLGAQQAAYLSGGRRLAVWTALGGLRAAGAVGTAGRGTLVQTSTMPVGATPLDAAVYNAAGRQCRPSSLALDPWVARALDELRDGLESAGLATTAAQRRTVRLWALAAFALVAVGVLRLVAGIGADRPVGLLTVSIAVVLALGIFLLTRTRQQTQAGRAALDDLRSRHTYLAPSDSPSYATYGASGAAMGIALYGVGTMYAIDPAFAAEAEVQRVAAGSAGTAGSTGGSCGGSSSSCSGGGSCGGGGGGGGCGG